MAVIKKRGAAQFGAVRRRPQHHEDDHQKSLFQWAGLCRLPPAPDVEPNAVLADYLFAIPNGGKRLGLEAKRLVGLGVKKGVSDLMLPLARGGANGLWIEMKKPRVLFRGKAEADKAVSKEQLEWIYRMRQAGYHAVVCYGWFEAQQVIRDYLEGILECQSNPS